MGGVVNLILPEQCSVNMVDMDMVDMDMVDMDMDNVSLPCLPFSTRGPFYLILI